MDRTARLSFAVFLLLSTLWGCTTMRADLDLGYQPEPTANSPLSSLAPMTVQLRVEDKRVFEEKNRVGNKENKFSMIPAPILSNREPPAVLYDALKAELMNNGHKVIGSPESSADVVLAVTLQRYWIDTGKHLGDLELIGTLNTHLLLRDPRKKIVLLAQPHNSTQSRIRVRTTEGILQNLLNSVLAEYITTFSRDPNILEALQKAGQSMPRQRMESK